MTPVTSRDGLTATTLYIDGKGGDLEVKIDDWSARVPKTLVAGSVHRATVKKRFRNREAVLKFVPAQE